MSCSGSPGRPSGLTPSRWAWSTVPAATAAARLSDIENGHGVDPDLVAAPLECGGAAQQAHPGLGCGVGGAVGEAFDARAGAEVHDAAAPLPQVRVDGLHRDQAPDDVDVQLACEIVGLEL